MYISGTYPNLHRQFLCVLYIGRNFLIWHKIHEPSCLKYDFNITEDCAKVMTLIMCCLIWNNRIVHFEAQCNSFSHIYSGMQAHQRITVLLSHTVKWSWKLWQYVCSSRKIFFSSFMHLNWKENRKTNTADYVLVYLQDN